MLPQAVRLAEELKRLKLDPELAQKLSGDPAQAEALSRLAAAASFVENNAEPLVAVDVGSSRISYMNGQAARKMPDLRGRGLAHPLLAGWEAAVAELKKGRPPPVVADVSFAMSSYERRAFYDAARDLAQFAFYEQRKKDTTGSALMNPFPVIDYSIPLGFVTFSNGAARKHFPGLGRGHRILQGVERRLPKLRDGSEKAVMDAVRVEERVYRRGMIYVGQGDLLRIYAADITDVSSRWKAQLMELSVRVEAGLNPADAAALTVDTAAALLAVRNEKVALGKVEIELNRLAVMLRSLDPKAIRPDEAESLRSVVAHFLDTVLKG